MFRSVVVPVITVIATLFAGHFANGDDFTIHLYDLNGTVLTGSGGRHNSIVVYHQDRGSEVNDLADNITANIPKFRTALGRAEDLDDDGVLQVTISLPPTFVERAIVIVIQRFSETAPTAVSPFTIVSPDNSQVHVHHIAVPKATMKAGKASCGTGRRCLFRRRCR